MAPRIPFAEDYFGPSGIKVPPHPKGGAGELRASPVWGEATLHCCSMETAINHPNAGDKYRVRMHKDPTADMVGTHATYGCVLSAYKNNFVPGVWQAGTKDKIEKDGSGHLLTSFHLIVYGGKGDRKAKTYKVVAEVTDKKGRQIPALFDAMKLDFTLKHGRAPTQKEIGELVRQDSAGIFGRKSSVDIVYTIRSVERTPNRVGETQIGIPKIRRLQPAGKSGTSGAERGRRSKAWKEADQCRRRIRGIKLRMSELSDEMQKDVIIERIEGIIGKKAA